MRDAISKAVRKVRKFSDSSDPFRICDDMGILVLLQNLGTEPGSIKGFSRVVKRIKGIVVNADLPEEVQRAVAAHEIGHVLLHCGGKIWEYHDIEMFNGGTIAEEEANLFAAELLLQDEDVMELLREEMPFFDVCAALCVPKELLDFKLRILKEKHPELGEIPINASPDFFKRY